MSRSHPPTLLTVALRTIKDEKLFHSGDRVLVAVSGGPDSMALLHVLATLRRDVGHVVIAHGIDHGLRDEAEAELDLAAEFARSLEVPFARTKVDLGKGGNIQARARKVRYDALEAAARSVTASTIATGHHADDRAETVLIRLLRGSGPTGLAALPPRSSPSVPSSLPRVRPLLRATHQSILAHVERHVVPYASDPSNRNPRYLRVRVRNELLPLLRALSPNIVAHLCALADQLQASRGEAAHIYPLPRATQNALAALQTTRSRKARIQLPGGLVATYDQTHVLQVASGATVDIASLVDAVDASSVR
ncbi:MAG: tRNA lysidine(34) synthetase TilS [Polyangiaceae bacterium]